MLFSSWPRVVAEDHPGDVQPERGDDRDPGAGAGQRLAGEEEVPLHREALQAGVDTVDKLSQIRLFLELIS